MCKYRQAENKIKAGGEKSRKYRSPVILMAGLQPLLSCFLLTYGFVP